VSELARGDDVDRLILDRLRENAREPAAAIADHVNLDPSAVRRRIAAMEKSGVIVGYRVAIDHDRLDTSVEAYVELSFPGEVDVHAVLADAIERPEVREAMTIAGDPDALVRLRVRNLQELREVVRDLRAELGVTGSRTKIVIGRWWHGSAQEATAGTTARKFSRDETEVGP
jgi:DNA-binding Lrp family transcriptional regulator